MVMKKHLHQINLPRFHSASSQVSPATQPSSSIRLESPHPVAPEPSNPYSFHIQPSVPGKVLRRSPDTAPNGLSSETISPEIKRTALPRESRNPAIALLKDALKSDSPTLPAFEPALRQESPQNQRTVAKTILSPQGSLDSAPAPHPNPTALRRLRRQKRRRLTRERRQRHNQTWTRQVSALRPSLKPHFKRPSFKRPSFKRPNFGKLGLSKLDFSKLKPSKRNEFKVTPALEPAAPKPVEPPPLTPEQLEALAQERLQRQARSRLWSMTWILGLMIVGSMGGIAYSLLTQLPPATNCEGMSPLASDGERLHCAQAAAKSGERADLIAGIQLIEDWQPSHPMYRKAQVSMNEWSAALLNEAKLVLQEEGLEPAVELATHIPPESPLYEEAQERIQAWEQEWQQGEEIYDKAIAAMSQQSWGVASDQIRALGQLELPYWQQKRATDLSLQIVHEQEAYQVLQSAQQQVKDDPSQLVSALKELQSVATGTLVSDEAQVLVQEWAGILIADGMEALETGDLDRALELVQSIPVAQIDKPIAQDLVQLSQAQQLADLDASHWQTNPIGIWRLMEAIAAAETITPESLLYGEAQDALAQWQGELEDLTQLQMAQWIASTGNRYTLDLAALQAEAIEPGRPRRVQAQTLIAHWRQESQRILDRPLLAQATAIAEDGTIDSLREAIAQLQSISPERAIFPQVEQAISQWTQQIQAIEDGPILTEARQLAADGKWQEAIAKAETIAAERSLHDIAQSNMAEWRSELQLEIDQRWLAEARSMAERRRLTSAINTASQIQPGQPLHNEAQSAINQWVEQREAIRARQAPQPTPAPTNTRSTPSRSSSPAPRQPSAPSQSSAPPQPSSAPPSNGNYDGYFDSRYYDSP